MYKFGCSSILITGNIVPARILLAREILIDRNRFNPYNNIFNNAQHNKFNDTLPTMDGIIVSKDQLFENITTGYVTYMSNFDVKFMQNLIRARLDVKTIMKPEIFLILDNCFTEKCTSGTKHYMDSIIQYLLNYKADLNINVFLYTENQDNSYIYHVDYAYDLVDISSDQIQYREQNCVYTNLYDTYIFTFDPKSDNCDLGNNVCRKMDTNLCCEYVYNI